MVTSNGMTLGRLGATQTVISDLRTAADTFMATLVGLPGNATSAETVRGDAQRNLQMLVDKLNSAFAGSQLFGGERTDTPPATNATGVVTTAFEAYRLTLPPIPPAVTPPSVEEVTAAQTEAFLAGDFAAEFDDANWTTNWSSASSTNIRSQISSTETLTTSANANDEAFRYMARAFSAIGSLPADKINENAFKAVVDYAMRQLGEAVNGLTVMEADFGSTQGRVKTVNEQLTVQRTFLNNSLVSMEGVDPYEAKVKMDALELQISLSFSLTSRLQKLNLLNFL